MGYYEVIYGVEGGKKGLLEWIKEEIEGICYSEPKAISVFINSLAESDEIRKGVFPCVHIYPVNDRFEKVGDCYRHETTVKLVATTKGPRKESFEQAIQWAGLIYDHFMKTYPDLEEIKHPAIEGEINFSWEGYRTTKHRNLMLSHSSTELVYEWRF